MIRPAVRDDLPALKVMGAAMHRESNFAPIPYDPERAAHFIGSLIDDPDGFVYVSERDNEITGFMFAMAYPAWFGNGSDRIASDLVLYVDPRWRHGTTAVLLVSAFKQWAIAARVFQVRGGTAAGDAGQAANAIYQYLGFAPSGQLFVFDVGARHVHPMPYQLEAAAVAGSA